MVKPSLKTTSFKHHPVYIQKSLHVDNPFYGPKPMYQRAEVIPGGDCEAVQPAEGIWAEDANGVWDITPDNANERVGDESLIMTQAGTAADGSIYLLLSSPIDLSWAKFVGFWYKGANGVTYVANDIDFYIFTAAGNYAYANAARYMSAMAYTEAGTAVWHYAELDLGDFTMNSGYETDMLEEVWGIGFCSRNLAGAVTMEVDQIEFYTVGTGLGPARGLIESMPLYDAIHAERGYGIAWNENSGRVDVSTANDYAFAGICTGNPSRTRLSKDGASGATSITVLDASLLEPGYASVGDDDSAASQHTISAVNKVTRTVTISTLNADYTVAQNAYICMEGNEEGTIRVDVLVDGIVNVTASGIVNQGYGAKCAAAGNVLTLVECGLNEEGRTIGKCMILCADEEDFPIKLTADARTA